MKYKNKVSSRVLVLSMIALGGGSLFLSSKPSNAQVVYQCKACPAGSYSSSSTGYKCKKCPKGTYTGVVADKCIPRPVGYYLRDNKPLKCTNDLQEIIAKDPTLPTLIDDIIKEMINKNNSCKDISNDKKGLIKQFYNILVKYIWEYDWLESCVSNEYADLIKNEMYDSYHKNLFYENITINFSNWSSCDNRKSDGWFRYVWIPDTQKRREDFFKDFLFSNLVTSYYLYIYKKPEYINKRKEISDKLKQSGNCKEYTTCYYGWGKKFNMYYVKNIYEEKVNKGCVYNENTPKKHFIVDDRYPDCK